MQKNRVMVSVALELAGIVLSIFLFYLAFPNNLSHKGFGVLAFIALLPLLRVVKQAPLWRLCMYGPIVGFGTYALFNIWLVNFHPLAIFIVPLVYAAYYLLLIPFLKLPVYALGRFAWVGQLLIWLAFEYLRTQGFLAYPYGIIGYTQYLNIPLVNFASLTGIWGVSALVLIPQFFLAQEMPALKALRLKPAALGFRLDRLKVFVLKFRPELIVMGLLFLFAFVYGRLSQVDYDGAPRVKMALVQQNVDPWVGGSRAYRASMEASIRQTRLALAEAPDIDLIVWSETSFIPAIEFHSRYRTEVDKYELVDELLAYIDSIDRPVLLGNGDGRLVLNDEGEYDREDYNAVYLYKNRNESQIYRKLHLVPFTEYFPFKTQLPWLYKILQDNDTSFWERGDEWTVFELDGLDELPQLRFSTPICFEDSFGYLSRGFVQRGAELIINLTNDSWSKSIPAATQHAAMAVFRSAENRRSLVRSTNGGLTAVIDPNGRILDTNTPFTESYIISEVPVYTASTGLYTQIGDLFAHIFLVLSILTVIFSVIRIIGQRQGSRQAGEREVSPKTK